MAKKCHNVQNCSTNNGAQIDGFGAEATVPRFAIGDIEELEYLLHSAAFLIRRLPPEWSLRYAVTQAAINLQLGEATGIPT